MLCIRREFTRNLEYCHYRNSYSIPHPIPNAHPSTQAVALRAMALRALTPEVALRAVDPKVATPKALPKPLPKALPKTRSSC